MGIKWRLQEKVILQKSNAGSNAEVSNEIESRVVRAVFSTPSSCDHGSRCNVNCQGAKAIARKAQTSAF